MKTTPKIVSIEEGKRIIKIYSQFILNHLPKLVSHSIENDKYILHFEWVDGNLLSSDKIEEAFFSLGQLHLSNKINDQEIGFTTICHGDFHLNNILDTKDGIKFIDVTYIKENWNYSDFDYVDFHGLYNKSEYPWMIKNENYLQAYHKGLGISLDKDTEEELKRLISINNIQKNILNGKANNIDTTFEEKILDKIK